MGEDQGLTDKKYWMDYLHSHQMQLLTFGAGFQSSDFNLAKTGQTTWPDGPIISTLMRSLLGGLARETLPLAVPGSAGCVHTVQGTQEEHSKCQLCR